MTSYSPLELVSFVELYALYALIHSTCPLKNCKVPENGIQDTLSFCSLQVYSTALNTGLVQNTFKELKKSYSLSLRLQFIKVQSAVIKMVPNCPPDKGCTVSQVYEILCDLIFSCPFVALLCIYMALLFFYYPVILNYFHLQ